MATPQQMTRKMKREIYQFYRVMQHSKNVCQNRGSGEEEDPRNREIRDNYAELLFYHILLEQRLEEMRRKLELWADNTAGTPQVFDGAFGSRIRLRKMLATTNELTDTQVDNYTVTDENWTTPGGGKNRYERFWEVLDAITHNTTLVTRRMNWWQDEWALQGSSPRENQVMAILAEEEQAAGLLRSVLADIGVRCRDQKGETETSVPELRFRNRFLKRRNAISGGIYSINQGVTTVELGGTVEPNEFDPDVDTPRDEPDLATDVV